MSLLNTAPGLLVGTGAEPPVAVGGSGPFVVGDLGVRQDQEAFVGQTLDHGVGDLLGFEDGQIWKTMKSQYEKRCIERQHYTTFEILQPLTDKLVRANPLKGRMQLGKIYIQKGQSWTEAYVRELMVFPAGKHDDQVDATAWCVRLTLTRGAPKPPPPAQVKSWKDKLNAIAGSDGASHMAA